MGAGLAFDAAQERYTRQDFIVLNYHVHIPAPDPMVNPATPTWSPTGTQIAFTSDRSGNGGGDVRGNALNNIITGNVVLYGAIAGEAYFRGVAGEHVVVREQVMAELMALR